MNSITTIKAICTAVLLSQENPRRCYDVLTSPSSLSGGELQSTPTLLPLQIRPGDMFAQRLLLPNLPALSPPNHVSSEREGIGAKLYIFSKF